MNSFKLEKLLDRLEYNLNPELNISLNNVSYYEEKKELILEFILESIPSIASLAEFNGTIKNKLIEKNLCSVATLIYNHKNRFMNKDEVNNYYRYILEVLKEKKLTYKSLDAFNTSFFDNEIVITIGEGNDEKIVKPLYSMIEKAFNQLGLNFVKFSLIKTPLVAPVSKQIEESKNNIEYEEVHKEVEVSKPVNSKGYKPPRNSSKINGNSVPINTIPTTESALIEYAQRHGTVEFVVEGTISTSSVAEKRGGFKIYEGILTDAADAIIIKTFISDKSQTEDFYNNKAKANCLVKVYGYAEYDKFARDIVLKIKDIISFDQVKKDHKKDLQPIKRVELHAHSKLTVIDSVLSIDDYVERAIQYGHTKLALTDKNSVQGLKDFLNAIESNNNKISPIYGMEGFLVDEDSFKIAFTDHDFELKKIPYVVYDFETTGLSEFHDEIIEIGACKVVDGMVVSEFQTLVNPRRPLSKFITELTSITNDDLRNAPFIEDVINSFKDFIDGCVLVAHNATFDNAFLIQNLKRFNLYTNPYPTIDTLNLSRIRYKGILKKFGLDDLRKYFDVPLENHHRASDDCKATALIFNKIIIDLHNDGITNYNQLNSLINKDTVYKEVYPTHITILSKNRSGLVNMNRIISDAHCNHLSRNPVITIDVLNKYREGLLVGSCCYHGEIFELAFKGNYQKMLEKAYLYDFFEIQPIDCYTHLLNENEIDIKRLYEAIELIIKLGNETNKLVVATGDVHQLDSEDAIYRKFLYDKALIGGGIHELHKKDQLPNQYFRTTEEMLQAFDFLSKEKAYEIVVTNSNKIADLVESYDLFPKELFAPSDDFMSEFGITSTKEEVKRLTYLNAHQIYGDPLPQIISERLEKELTSIIGNNYASIYYISYLLVRHSVEAGYVVGSRGSIGSSLVANFMDITEVNSLAPHYICPHCKFTAFKYTENQVKKYKPTKEELDLLEVLRSVGSGLDLPMKQCPKCSSTLVGDGFDIPFETFLGFEGEKIPDIDLNFSGEYQSKAHDYCREIFGVNYTFRGGTIGTIAEKTAENYVSSYFKNRDIVIRRCQMMNLSRNLVGVKRQTGQHPGGIIVVPKGIDINEVTPIQYPADDITNPWKTTHLDYHKFEANLLKLDILGHDDPTMIRFLMDFVEKYPNEFNFSRVWDIPIFDRQIIKLFNGVEVLGLDPKVIRNTVASSGLPEFGTRLAKDMLSEIKPNSIAELIKISGLSHGTNVWAGNARDYFLGLKEGYGKIPFEQLIGCRDDIMVNLIYMGLTSKDAFSITERVRKGKGVLDSQEKLMRKHNVPLWYIDSCKAIKYLFPKAHATAYVIYALRIAWFKLYKPLYYYAGFFTKRTDAFDVVTLVGGIDAITKRVDELSKNDFYVEDETKSESSESRFEETSEVKAHKMLTGLIVALEMVARGFKFLNVSINHSHATEFLIEGDGLRIPFIAVDSLGETTAKAIMENRGENLFTSIKDVQIRGKVNPKMLEKLAAINALDDLPKEDDEGLFKFI